MAITKEITMYSNIDPYQYLPLVKSIVDRLDVKAPAYWDREDLISYGILGLLESIRRFQPDKGVPFASYASKRIRGAIIDAIRKESPLSRNCWQKVQIITDAIDRISSSADKKAVTIDEITKEVSKTVEMEKSEIESALQSFRMMNCVSLEQTLGFGKENSKENNGIKIQDTLKAPFDQSPEEVFTKKEQIKTLGAAIETLDERQRLVLTLYYYEELTLKEISNIMDISVGRVSQLKTQALATLRKQMEKQPALN
jgi:RNA polymerase sigma factor for flagellar operon FliA